MNTVDSIQARSHHLFNGLIAVATILTFVITVMAFYRVAQNYQGVQVHLQTQNGDLLYIPETQCNDLACVKALFKQFHQAQDGVHGKTT